jgi:hypothetical protein
MDGGGPGVQGLSYLCVYPVTPADPKISFQENPRLEQPRRGGPPSSHKNLHLFALFWGEPDNIFHH